MQYQSFVKFVKFVAENSLPLFDGAAVAGVTRPIDPLSERRRARDRVAHKAGEPFRIAFTKFVVDYLTEHAKGNGEGIREAYERTSSPQPHAWQAAGGVYAKLRRDGVIQEVGKVRSRKFGNDISVIALVKS